MMFIEIPSCLCLVIVSLSAIGIGGFALEDLSRYNYEFWSKYDGDLNEHVVSCTHLRH